MENFTKISNDEFLGKYVLYLKGKKKKSPNTITAYRTDASEFLGTVQKPILETDSTDLWQYTEYLQITFPEKVSTRNRKLVAVRSFLSFMSAKFSYHFDPDDLSPEKVHFQQFLEDQLTAGEFLRLVEAAKEDDDHRAVAIFYTFFLTGVRVSELLQIPRDAATKKSIKVIGKGRKIRKVILSREVKAHLKAFLPYRHRTSDMMFTGKNGTLTRQYIDRVIKKYASKRKIAIAHAHAHSFRHLFCLQLAAKGVPLEVIAELAGHGNINTTRIYVKKTEADIRKLLDGIAAEQKKELRKLRNLQKKRSQKSKQTVKGKGKRS